MKVKRWSRPASIAFSLLFIAIMCFTLLPSPIPFGGAGVASADTETFTTAGTYYWICPAGVISVKVEAWGGGGGGGGYINDYDCGPGGGGGAYARLNSYTVTPGGNYTIIVGIGGTAGGYNQDGGTGGGSSFGNTSVLLAVGGGKGIRNTRVAGVGGASASCIGDTKWSGGNGANGVALNLTGAGGGGGAGDAAVGGNAVTSTGGTGGSAGGGKGGDLAADGTAPGGAGGGGYCNSALGWYWQGKAGQAGQVKLTYTACPTTGTLAATSITATTATLNGNITSLGSYGNVTQYGFVLSTSTQTNPGNVSPSAQTTYTAGNWTWTAPGDGYGAGQTFTSNGNVTGLSACTTYFFRAAGYNSAGWSYGNEICFTTTGCGSNFLAGYTNRIKVETTSVSTITGDAEMFNAFYSGVAIDADSICEFLYRPAARYVGTYDRTYIASTNTYGLISIKQWDETALTLSSAVTLWDFATNPTDDHQGCSVIILQHQTGGNASENGTILVAVGANPTHYLGTRRSDNAEDISSWGTAVIAKNDYEGWYPQLTETSDGTIRLFSQDNIADTVWLTEYRTLTLAANPDNDTWSAPTVLFTRGAGYNTYAKPWVDGLDIHFGFGSLIAGSSYENIWYIKFQGNDTTWRTADGTVKTLPLDMSNAAHTPDVVHTGTVNMIWDTKTDALHNPYLLWYYSPWSYDGDLYRSYYSAGWQNVDTGINIHGIDESSLMSGAQLKEDNVDVIYAGVPDAGNKTQIEAYERLGNETWQLADGTNGTTAIAGDGRITQAALGWNFRPATVLNGAGHFEILWFYTERYDGTLDWESMQMAYPGFSNQNFLCLNKISRTDFGDLRLTKGDGSTLQPSTSSGTPWIQEKTDSWRALLWWKVGNVPVSPLALTNYVYYGNATNTNANAQTIMDAQFLACDGFDNGTTLDTNKWALTNTVSVASGNLELTGVAVNQGIIDQNITNYPLFTYAEVRFKAKGNDTAVGSYSDIGLRGTGSWNEAEIFLWMDAANRYDVQTRKAGGANVTILNNMDTANWHIMRVDWSSTQGIFYNDLNSVTNRAVSVLQATHTSSISTSAQGLVAGEGNADSGVVYVDWIFSRPLPSNGIFPTVLVLTQEAADISNTPSSWSVGVVQPSQTYWAKTNSTTPPSFPLASGNCTGNITNNSIFSVDITAYAGNMTGGAEYELVSGAPGADEFRLSLFKSGESDGAEQDYTTYTEVDPNSHISKTSSTITYSELTSNETAYVYKDFGVDYFSGDFHFYVDGSMSSASDNESYVGIWGVTNNLDDFFGLLVEGNLSSLFLYMTEDTGAALIYLNEIDGSDSYEDDNSFSLDTMYYFDIYRDESVGTYGTVYCKIYDSSAERATQTGVVDTLSIALHTSKKDFRYLYGLSSFNLGTSPISTGWVSNLIMFPSLSIDGLILTNIAQSWITSLGVGNSTLWELKFETWSSNSDGAEKTCIITFTAEAS